MMSHTTVEVVAFPYAQFQTCVISGKAVVKWPPNNFDLYSLIIPPSLRHDSTTPTKTGDHLRAEENS